MTEDYRSLLEKLMDTMSEVVQAEGQPAPVFYVFSETVKQCPSEDTGTFDEFPDWELDPDEVRGCPWVITIGVPPYRNVCATVINTYIYTRNLSRL